jgi:transcriptional regulator with XRE-family HTH domain
MADIGTTLRETRMRARIDISEVEARTKIRAKYLRAIENEEWEMLPGPVYVKSFLRTYADFLRLDSRALIDEYKRQYERPFDTENRPIAALSRERERPPRGRRLPPWVAIVAVLMVVVAALYVVGSLGSRHKSSPPPVSAARTTHKPSRAPARPAPAPPPAPRSVTLQLVPTGRVYVCLVNGRGKALIPGVIFTPGQAIPTETADKLLLTLGNASVKMKVNGKDVPVSESPNSIGLLLQPAGTRPLPPSKQPTCA